MNFVIQTKHLKGESSKWARKTSKVKQNGRLVMSLHPSFLTYAVSTAILLLCTVYSTLFLCLVVKYLTVTSSAFPGTDTPNYGIHGWGFARKGNARAIRHTVNIALEEMYPNGQNPSLRQQPFLLALRRWGRFAKRPQRRRARRNGCFCRLSKPLCIGQPLVIERPSAPFRISVC